MVEGSDRPHGKVARLARSRAACEACHKVKQRCDGPSVCPCHRCKLWGIECIFPSSAGKAASSASAGGSGTSSNKKGKAAANVAEQATASPASSLPTPTVAEPPGPDLREELRAMHEKLQAIEATLARAQVTFPPVASSSSRRAPSHSGQTNSGHSPSTGHDAQLHEHRAGTSNPVEAAGEALAVEGLVDLSTPNRSEVWDVTRPDVLSRSIMTVEECEEAFDVYFNHLQPFTTLLSSTSDRQPLLVRERSPLLFHAILLLALYYRPRTIENIALYRTVGQILDSILAPQILCAQPDQLVPDFIRALHLLLIYKPIQINMLSARGIKDPSTMEHASKMNIRASFMLRLIISRTAAFTGLPSITTSFARAFANQHITPIPEELISEQRLYFSGVFHESHGALQSGKPANFIPHESLKTTRLFAALRTQPSDVRLAASVELAATAATALARRQDGDVVEKEDLARFDEEMDAWHEYWRPVLATEFRSPNGNPSGAHMGSGDNTAHGERDSLAWIATYPYAAFVRVVINGFAFTRWKAEKKQRSQQLRREQEDTRMGTASSRYHGDNMDEALAPAALGEDERASIEKAVVAAQGILLAISNEGKRVTRELGIEPSWDGVGHALSIDLEMASALRWASDSLACVVFSYPLIFLAKMANEGLLGPDITLVQAHTPIVPLAPLEPTDKLCRLLQLGADFLDAIAPNPAHPSVKQAAFLRRIREAGISGRRGVMGSAPGSPRALSLHGPPPSSSAANAGQLHRDLASIHRQQQQASGNFQQPFASAAILTETSVDSTSRSTYHDFALASSYEPSPVHSPPGGTSLQYSLNHRQHLSAPHQPHQSQQQRSDQSRHDSSNDTNADPFSTLLGGASHGNGGNENGLEHSHDTAASSFFGLDGDGGFGGVKWDELEADLYGVSDAFSAGFM